MIPLGVFMLAVGTLRLEYRVVREGVKHKKEYDATQCKLQGSVRITWCAE